MQALMVLKEVASKGIIMSYLGNRSCGLPLKKKGCASAAH